MSTLQTLIWMLFLLLFPLHILAQQKPEWEFINEEKGIRTFSRILPESGIKEVKVQKLIKARLSSLVALMKDLAHHHDWVYANKSAEILKENGNYSWVFYALSKAPWPIQDRDMLIQASLVQDSASGIIRNAGFCDPDFISEKEGIVRVPDCHSLWTLEPLGNGEVRVSLELYVDLGGNIPKWLLNLVITKGPYRTLRNMEIEVQKPEYKNAQLDFIKE